MEGDRYYKGEFRYRTEEAVMVLMEGDEEATFFPRSVFHCDDDVDEMVPRQAIVFGIPEWFCKKEGLI